jgi:hypothetical protein
VAVVSISHVTQWYGISNPVSWAVYLSIGIEIAALSALAAISANMGSKVYFPFAIVTVVQFIGNIFFAYSFIDITSKHFKDWVDLVSPLVEFMGVDNNDYVGHKRFLALFAGGMLPLISLSFLHMLVKFTEEDRKNEEKVIFEEEKHLIDDNIIKEAIEKYKKENELSKPEDLKEFVDESTRIRLSEKDLEILEKALSNPTPPNEKLKEAAKTYNETVEEKPWINLPDETWERMKKIEAIRESLHGPILPEDEPTGALANSGIRERLEMEQMEREEAKQVEVEKTQLQKLEDYVNPTVEPTPEFEIPVQEGWTEEMEQRYWEEQAVEPFATPEEVEKYQIDSKAIDNTLNQVNEEIDNQPQPTQTITVVLDEEKLKPFDINIQVEETQTQESEPSFEVTAEKKNL